MAKCTITFADDADDKVHATYEFDPPLVKGQQTLTGAQQMGYQVMNALTGSLIEGAMDGWIEDEAQPT